MTDRIPLDAMTSDALDDLYRRIETLEHVAAGNKRHVQLIVPDLERAEATIERVREWADYHANQCEGWCCDHAPQLLATLDEQPSTEDHVTDRRKDDTIRDLHAAISRIRNIDHTPPLLDADTAYVCGWQAHHAAVETELIDVPGSEQRTAPLADLGAALGEERPAAWTPPPPGDKREQLPDAMLDLIRDQLPDYLSTACQTADTLGLAACYPGSGVPRPQYDEIREHAERLHNRCRINQKFTGQLCACGCH